MPRNTAPDILNTAFQSQVPSSEIASSHSTSRLIPVSMADPELASMLSVALGPAIGTKTSGEPDRSCELMSDPERFRFSLYRIYSSGHGSNGHRLQLLFLMLRMG